MTSAPEAQLAEPPPRKWQGAGSNPAGGSRWVCSSDGRVPALQAGGRRFDSYHIHQRRGVAQWTERHDPNVKAGGSIPPALASRT